MGQVCEKCLSSSQYCPECDNGDGICRDCKGTGVIVKPDRQMLKTEYRKGPGGEKIPEVITTVIKGDTENCFTCGGWGDTKLSNFRGNVGGGPVDYGSMTAGRSSPPKGRAGDGKCKRCSGTGKTTVPLVPLARKLKF